MATSAHAAFINFENCLPSSIVDSDPRILQFIPQHVWAAFDPDEGDNLNITVYGNVSGTATDEPYPAPRDPRWSNPEETLGKIVDLSVENNKYSTLLTKLNVLSFTPYEKPTRFCDSVIQGECPLAPVFYVNASDPSELRSFSIEQELSSSYAFTTITANLRITSGDANSLQIACVSANITPALGPSLRHVVSYLPLAILILVGLATASAAIFSPWGSSDLFKWTSNYGRDEDLLRLVTPGFADCLQYIQFVVLTGGLSLNYPGYYQPVVSQASWAALMFNQSLVTQGDGAETLTDGLYHVNGTYGLDRLSQLIGMTSVEDVWAGMVVWLLAIVAGVIVLIQLGFLGRWIHHQIAHIPEEDLRSKNFPFTVGNVVRVVFNCFLLPVVSLSMFQFVIAGDSPPYTVALAVLLIVVLIGFAAWLLYLIASTRPRSFLFDDLPTVLLYGPLYNTFSDDAAAFALIPVLLTFIRGIAIGAIQPSGIAQLVLLAICEVILALTLNAFRPFHSPTSMNAYHTFFAVVRFLTLLLSVAFLPTLGIGDGPRGFIGYVILLMHAIVLVFGFFLNAAQTLIEVIARLAGAGGDGAVGGGAARGGLVKVFGKRQLSKRVPRRTRHSTNSQAAILGNDPDRSSHFEPGRARSLSGSTAFLLNRANPSDGRISAGVESGSGRDIRHSRGGSGPYSPTTPAAVSAFSHGHRTAGSGSTRGEIIGLHQTQTADPYYRPPRSRRVTLDPMPPAARSRSSWAGGDWMRRTFGTTDDGDHDDLGEGPSISRSGTPVPAYLGAPREDPDEDNRQSKTDYAVREVDFYYRVRGPALGNIGSRRLKTGPADPTGPVSSATGWFRGLFGGKTKDKGKGFEVVRSARAPPPARLPSGELDTFQEPYTDEPEGRKSGEPEPKVPDGDQEEFNEDVGNRDGAISRGSHELAPLPLIEPAGAIEMPSQIGSRSSSRATAGMRIRPPTIPRKSSKRNSSTDMTGQMPRDSLSGIPPSADQPAPRQSQESTKLYDPDDPSQRHLQPSNSRSGRIPFGPKGSAAPSSLLSTTSTSSTVQHSVDEDQSQNQNQNQDQNQVYAQPKHMRHSSVLGHFASDTHNDRPSSVGYVQQHRTSDNITEASPEEVSFTGSTAEFIGSPLQRERT
ncbi:hypothetical protein FQN54_005525 [Arachnomyces sp. PD_36]|nr:hypothetical protein FQN54_005525 [Arachnomyces sp. PD_36]